MRVAMPELRGVARRQGRRLTSAAARAVPWLAEWEHLPEGWPPHDTEENWNDAGVARAYERKLAAVREALDGTRPIDFATSPALPTESGPEWEQRAILAYAYALALASRGTERVSVLDWGGGAGVFYLLSGALLPPEVELEYHVKETARVCAYGREALPEVHFHEDESCLERRHDLVLASSSLQYSEDWARVLRGLASATAGYLFLTRVPVVSESASFVVRQRVRAYGRRAAYPSWVLGRDELLAAAARSGVELVREFVLGYRPRVRGAPEQDETRAFLFRAQ
jgi:putative methyltransferase (TIGR04325 family)